MKKKLLLATVLVSFAALSQAQQKGVGINTTTPAATLDVVADTTNNRMPDAVLVPRMTVDQLAAKDGAYAAAQNGALVFVTSGRGSGGKTGNVTGAGFYYYDDSTSKWAAVGGGTAPNPAMNITTEQTSSYTATVTDDIILLNITSAGNTLTLPTSGIPVGKKYYVTNRGGNSMDVSPLPREEGTQNIPGQQGLIFMYLGGSGNGSWSIISGF